MLIFVPFYVLFYQAEKRELTAAEKLAEKIRLQKIQEEADLKNAKDLFGKIGIPLSHHIIPYFTTIYHMFNLFLPSL